MTIDLSQFHDTFFEESFEGLDIMEAGLLELEQGDVDLENINTIFRSAHSIKGGSGTFGFTDVAEFTHDMETLLDQMRNGDRKVTPVIVNMLLSCVDVLRNMITAIKNKTEVDKTSIKDIRGQLVKILDNEEVEVEADKEQYEVSEREIGSDSLSDEEGYGNGYQIKFKPYPDIMKSGNDTVRLLRELYELADEVIIDVDNSELPELEDLEPESIYQSWDIKIFGDEINKRDIEEVFAWVEDECDLEIIKINETKDELSSDLKKNIRADKKESVQQENDKRASRASESASIRVNINKVDELINMVGELVITQSMLSQFGDSEDFRDVHLERLKNGLAQLESHTRELQDSVMRIRMMPISFAFQRFPRLVHDLSSVFNKKIELIMEGENTELDKTVLEKISDPLIHLIRNSLDHGIEKPEDRVKAGKSETGVIKLKAYHQGGSIMIEIKDDGAGLNKKKILEKARQNNLIEEDVQLSDDQIYDLIFKPGFSTAETVSDVSGRGVGMDVVRRNIRELGGMVDVASNPGVGSEFTIRLPLTLAILDGQLVGIGDETYILPVISIVESLQVKVDNINAVAGNAEVYRLRDEYIPVIRLYQLFGIKPASEQLEQGLLVVVEAEGNKVALFVDDLLGQQQVVIKSLETNFKKVDGVSGATILGNGTVSLILDIAGLIELYQKDIAGITKKVKGAA